MKKQAEAWLNAARDDLAVISEIIDNPTLTHMVAFHAQQAIEKGFKALLEEKDEAIPRTHNIILLREMADKIVQFKFDINIFNQINELYIDSRYPTDIGLLPNGKPGLEDALGFYKLSEKIINEITEFLQ